MFRTDFLEKRLDNLLFTLRIYEMYSKNAPSDIMLIQLCEKYRKKYECMLEKYESPYGDT